MITEICHFCRIRSFFSCFLLTLCSVASVGHAGPVTHTVFVENAADERSALRSGMREAMQRSIYVISRKEGWELPDFLRKQLLDEYARYVIERRIKDMRAGDGGLSIEMTVDLDVTELRGTMREMVGASVADLAAAAGDPGVAIAIAPRLRTGINSGEMALIRTQVAERFKAMLGEKFLEAGFRSLQSPTWVEQEISQLRRGTSGTEVNAEGTLARDSARDFVQNIRYRSQSDLWVDFAVAGVADLSFARNAKSGLHDVSLDFTGSIFHTHAPKVGLAEPLTTSTKASDEDLQDAIQAAVIRVTDKLFEHKVFDRMLAAWESQQRRGRAYAVGLFYDDDDFRREVRGLLRSVGEIAGSEDIDSYRQVIYFRPEKLDRSQMRDADAFLEVAEANGDFDIDDFFVRGRPGELFIAERGSRHEKTIEAGLTTAPDLLVDYELLKFGVKPQADEPTPSSSAPAAARLASAEPASGAGLPLELRIQNAAKAVRPALGVVSEFDPKTDKISTFGTAWAVGPHTWVTNAHISEGVREKVGQGKVVVIFPNRTKGKTIPVIRTQDHPLRDKLGTDAGILFTDKEGDSATHYLKLSRNDELYKLDQGEPIFTLGYPMENIVMKGVNAASPEAVLQTGITVAVTTLSLVRDKPEKNQIIRHSMPTAGGASGSPVFNQRGEVIGIHFAGNYIQQPIRDEHGRLVLDQSRKPLTRRIPVHGQNLAWRADAIRDMLANFAPDILD